MGIYGQIIGATDEWYSPPYIFTAMGVEFDLDVASPGADVVPWIPARKHITKQDPPCSWHGFAWMNAPFGGRNGLAPWLSRFFSEDISGGVCLTPDRTSAPWWQTYSRRAGRILFVSPRVRFIGADGIEGKSPAQGTTLMSRGERGNMALENAARNGLGTLFVPQSLTDTAALNDSYDRPLRNLFKEDAA